MNQMVYSTHCSIWLSGLSQSLPVHVDRTGIDQTTGNSSTEGLEGSLSGNLNVMRHQILHLTNLTGVYIFCPLGSSNEFHAHVSGQNIPLQ